MHIMITDVVGEKRIDLADPVRGKEVAAVSMFSNIIQYKIRKPLKVLLIMNEERQLLKGIFMEMHLKEGS